MTSEKPAASSNRLLIIDDEVGITSVIEHAARTLAFEVLSIHDSDQLPVAEYENSSPAHECRVHDTDDLPHSGSPALRNPSRIPSAIAGWHSRSRSFATEKFGRRRSASAAASFASFIRPNCA